MLLVALIPASAFSDSNQEYKKQINLGLAYTEQGKYEEAIDAYKQAIRIDPDIALSHYLLGLVYGGILDRYQEAVDAYTQAIKINPDYAEAYLSLGVAYGQLGRHQEAVDAYKQAIRINADYAEAYLNLGVAYGQLGKVQELVKAYKQVIRINPDDTKAHYFLGLAYFLLLNDKGSALEEYKILKDLDKELANKLFNTIYKQST